MIRTICVLLLGTPFFAFAPLFLEEITNSSGGFVTVLDAIFLSWVAAVVVLTVWWLVSLSERKS